MELASTKHITRIAIVGVGQVGASAAYALTLTRIAAELLLVDIRAGVRDSLVHDLSDVARSSNSSTRIRAANYQEIRQCDIVVLSPSSEHSCGETRIQRMYKQVAIVQSIVNRVKPFRPDTILLVAANPVDLLCSIAQELSGLPPSQVLGSGTFFESVRLCRVLADETRVAANSVDVSILGVHGESQVIAWSCGKICGLPMADHLPNQAINNFQFFREGKYRAPSLVRPKGTTSFGFGSVVSNICSIILLDKCEVCPISHYQPDFACCFSWPVVLGRNGIVRKVELPLDKVEEANLAESTTVLRNTIARLKEDL